MLELLIIIINTSKNEQTLKRSINAIFKLLEDNSEKLQTKAGTGLASLGISNQEISERLTSSIQTEEINKEVITKILEIINSNKHIDLRKSHQIPEED